jgi:hypothetical protein
MPLAFASGVPPLITTPGLDIGIGVQQPIQPEITQGTAGANLRLSDENLALD